MTKRLRGRIKRLICKLTGCAPSEYGPRCERCWADPYDDEFVQIGWLGPIFEAHGWLRAHAPHWVRCGWCNKRLHVSVSADMEIEFCSEQCEKDWFPF